MCVRQSGLVREYGESARPPGRRIPPVVQQELQIRRVAEPIDESPRVAIGRHRPARAKRPREHPRKPQRIGIAETRDAIRALVGRCGELPPAAAAGDGDDDVVEILLPIVVVGRAVGRRPDGRHEPGKLQVDHRAVDLPLLLPPDRRHARRGTAAHVRTDQRAVRPPPARIGPRAVDHAPGLANRSS